MREIIMTGKTVEEATAAACAELGVSEADVSVEIIDLPQKKLFKQIPAKVKVTAEDAEEKAAEAAPQAAAEPQAEKPAAPAEAKPAPKDDDSMEYAETELSEENKAKAEAAAAYLKEVGALMGAEGIEVNAVQCGEAVILKVSGDDSGTLIGHRGEVMAALSYLCGLVANKLGGEYTRVNLDVNGYRAKRENNLETLAKRIGAKVAKTGRSHTLEPMNPYERRIIHAAIGQMEGVKSESTGEGINRRVVISSTSPNAQRGGRGGRGGYRGNGNGSRGYNRGEGRGPRRESSTPRREFADAPRAAQQAPSAPVRTEKIDDTAGLDLPLYGKIEL